MGSPAVKDLSIGGVVEASAKFKWSKLDDDNVAGYKIYWRDTTSPTWDYSRFVGNEEEATLEGIVIDNYFFGLSTVGKNGVESPVVFPNKVIRYAFMLSAIVSSIKSEDAILEYYIFPTLLIGKLY